MLSFAGSSWGGDRDRSLVPLWHTSHGMQAARIRCTGTRGSSSSSVCVSSIPPCSPACLHVCTVHRDVWLAALYQCSLIGVRQRLLMCCLLVCRWVLPGFYPLCSSASPDHIHLSFPHQIPIPYCCCCQGAWLFHCLQPLSCARAELPPRGDGEGSKRSWVMLNLLWVLLRVEQPSAHYKLPLINVG